MTSIKIQTRVSWFVWQTSIYLLICSATKVSSYEIHPPNGAEMMNSTTGEHPCYRPCNQNEKPKICYYTFDIEFYYTLSMACYKCPDVESDCQRVGCVAGDGRRRGLVTVNRQMPGPAIEVCQLDTIVVDLANGLGSESTSIHWHGLHQKRTPYMDGVPLLTQCPQTPGSVFRYRFEAAQAGTYFWHSHSGFQRSDGAYGALIIRVPQSADPHHHLYDTDLPEHTVLLTDWIKEMAVERFVSHHHSTGTNKPETILINGRGRMPGGHRNSSQTPLTNFLVEKNKRHRFRVVSNGVMNCPLLISVDNHNITVIASDGNDLQPVTAESLVVYAGERYDIILHANQRPGVYWFKVQGLMDCGEKFSKAHQVAVVRYRDVTQPVPDQPITYAATFRSGKQISPFNVAKVSELEIPVSALRSASEVDDATSRDQVDSKFYLDYDFNRVDNLHFHDRQHYSVFAVEKHLRMLTPQFNEITLKMPSSPPLSQPEVPLATCNRTSVGDCRKEFCECTHVLHLPLGHVVELLIIDRGFTYNANHPMHLHGHSFRVVAMEKLGSNVTRQQVIDRDLAGSIKRNLKMAPLKDTVTIPDGGYTVVRFHATNPGWWLFHCHMNFHSEIGMAVIFHVGQPQNVGAVPRGFPQCGHFVPAETSHSSQSPAASHRLTSSSAKIDSGQEVVFLKAVIFSLTLSKFASW